jgi:hypothetical protein
MGASLGRLELPKVGSGENIAKDNFLFGVRAVDTDGNRSVVTFPVPK